MSSFQVIQVAPARMKSCVRRISVSGTSLDLRDQSTAGSAAYYKVDLDEEEPEASLALAIEDICHQHPEPHRLRIVVTGARYALVRVEPKTLTPRQIQKALAALPSNEAIQIIEAAGFEVRPLPTI